MTSKKEENYRCLSVKPETWKLIVELKYKLGFRSFDQTIRYLLSKETKEKR